MNSKYAPIVALTTLGVLVILALGWFVLISPQLGEASDVRATTDKVEANTQTIATETKKLAEYEVDLDDGSDLSAVIAHTLPASINVQELRSHVLEAVRGSGTEVSSLEFGSSFPVEGWEVETRGFTSAAVAKLFQTTPIAVEGATAPAPEDGTDTQGSAGDYVPPVPANRPAGPVVEALYGMPVTLTVAGTYAEAKQVLALLQDDDKQLFLLYDLNVTARNAGSPPLTGVTDAADGDVLVTVTGAFYFLDPSIAIEDEPLAVGPIPATGTPFVPGDVAAAQPGAS